MDPSGGGRGAHPCGFVLFHLSRRRPAVCSLHTPGFDGDHFYGAVAELPEGDGRQPVGRSAAACSRPGIGGVVFNCSCRDSGLRSGGVARVEDPDQCSFLPAADAAGIYFVFCGRCVGYSQTDAVYPIVMPAPAPRAMSIGDPLMRRLREWGWSRRASRSTLNSDRNPNPGSPPKARGDDEHLPCTRG